MKIPNADDWWNSAQLEIDTLEQIDAWDVVDYNESFNVLLLTLAFRLKIFPNGAARNYKGLFYI